MVVLTKITNPMVLEEIKSNPSVLNNICVCKNCGSVVCFSDNELSIHNTNMQVCHMCNTEIHLNRKYDFVGIEPVLSAIEEFNSKFDKRVALVISPIKYVPIGEERKNYKFIMGTRGIILEIEGNPTVFFDPSIEYIMCIPEREDKLIKFTHGGDPLIMEALRIAGENMLGNCNTTEDHYRAVNPDNNIYIAGRGTVLVFDNFTKDDFKIGEKLITMDGFKCEVIGLEYGWTKGVGVNVKPSEEVNNGEQ